MDPHASHLPQKGSDSATSSSSSKDFPTLPVALGIIGGVAAVAAVAAGAYYARNKRKVDADQVMFNNALYHPAHLGKWNLPSVSAAARRLSVIAGNAYRSVTSPRDRPQLSISMTNGGGHSFWKKSSTGGHHAPGGPHGTEGAHASGVSPAGGHVEMRRAASLQPPANEPEI